MVILLFFLLYSSIAAQKAVITAPVVDLVGQPMLDFHNKKKCPIKAYDDLAWSAGSNQFFACPRLHQALFNEVVELCEIRSKEARIKIPNIYYITHQSSHPKNDYWVLKDHLKTFDELKKLNIDTTLIPDPIDFNKRERLHLANNITLKCPFYDQSTKQTYSAGTRFVKTKKQPSKKVESVYLFNNKTMKMVTTQIPKKYIYYQKGKSQSDQVTDFVKIMREWIQNDGIIPYVLGGCSFIETHETNDFSKKNTIIHGKQAIQYFRSQEQKLKAGLDCAGLITRVAQICGIPYFFKNSFTLAQKLETLKKNESLQEGDLIWFPGHVMIVGCRKNNTIIEARSYDHGYGIIHEIPINKAFKSIETLSALEHAFAKKKPLKRINNNGKVMNTFPHFKLLKLSTVWN